MQLKRCAILETIGIAAPDAIKGILGPAQYTEEDRKQLPAIAG
jgi:hypothetical protein